MTSGLGGVSLIEGTEPAGHIAGDVEQDDRELFGHALQEMMQRRGLDLNRLHGGDGIDGGNARDWIDHAHFAKESVAAQDRQGNGVFTLKVLDHFDITLDEDVERMARLTFADDDFVGEKRMIETFLCQQGKRVLTQPGQDGGDFKCFNGQGILGDHGELFIGKTPPKGKHRLGQMELRRQGRPRIVRVDRMKGIAPIVGWVILGLALLVSFVIDCRNVAQGGSIDLRNRITGVRLLENGIDPYHYKWHTGDSEEYCDPFNNPNLAVSKTTVSPGLLVLNIPLAQMPYRTAQWCWLVIQWLLLVGTLFLWLHQCTTTRQQWLVSGFITGLTYTAAWRLHAERGQTYVVLLLLFACWLILTMSSKRGNGFWAGFLAGLLAAFRPPLLALLPFMALHRRGQLLGAAAGLLVGVGLPILGEANCWTAYSAAMQTYTEVYRTDFNPHYHQAYPAEVEHIPLDTLAGFVTISYADFSAHALLKSFDAEPFPVLLVLLVALAPFGLWLWLSRAMPVERLLVGLAAWMFLIDLFLPSYRNNYNDVLIINILALAVIGATRIPWGVWPCLAALPLGWFVYVAVPEQAAVINLPTFCFTVGALVFLCQPGSPAQQTP